MDSITMTLNLDSHPLSVINHIKTLLGDENAVFEYSIYVPGPPGITLNRTIKQVNSSNISMSWLQSELDSLAETEELAWHSRVYCNGKVSHIPMIDFTGTIMGSGARKRLLELIHNETYELFIYDSGRSIHAYLGALLDENRWYSYLGSILLLNHSGKVVEHMIDCRWVGHCLEHGYSALRWSCNTTRYTKIPSLVSSVLYLVNK